MCGNFKCSDYWPLKAFRPKDKECELGECFGNDRDVQPKQYNCDFYKDMSKEVQMYFCKCLLHLDQRKLLPENNIKYQSL